MKSKFLLHSCWAVAVLAAFLIGSRRSGKVSRDAGPGTVVLSADAAVSAPYAGGPLARMKSDRPDARTGSALEGLFGTVASSGGDLGGLIQQALRDKNPITRRLAFARLLESLTPENAGSVRGQLVALGAEPEQLRDFHYAWGALDGPAAFASAAQTPEPDLAATMTGWAAANPAAALALLDNLPAGMQGQRDELVASVVAGLSQNDTAMATSYVQSLALAGNEKAGALMETVASATLRQLGPAAASVWAASLADGPLKGSAMARVADAFVREDPLAAARWAGSFADQDYAARTIQQVGTRWAASDPPAAVGWLESLPASTGQKQGLSGAFGDWEDRDPVAAGDYLFAMAKSPQRDAAISGFATGYAWQDPQTAIAWAYDISDPAIRESSLTRAGQAFYRRDPEGALTWLPQSGLSEEARQQVLAPRRR